MKANELLSKIGYEIADDFKINAIQIDSRLIKNNDIFIAIEGVHFDGHDFIEEAKKNGARLIISEKIKTEHSTLVIYDIKKKLSKLAYYFYDQVSDDFISIGVTGTNGKTSVSTLIYQVLKAIGENVCLIGTNGMYFEDEVIPLVNTTPNGLVLMKYLKQMKEKDIHIIVMEVSSHAIEEGRVDYMKYDQVIFTNLTQDHLDYHGNMENYFKSKSKLFKKIKQDGCAIINIDDDYGKRLVSMIDQNVITYSITNDSNYKCNHLNLDLFQSQFELDHQIIKTRLLSIANIYNTISVYISLKELNYDIKTIKEVLLEIESINGRLEKVYLKDYLVIVDYAHSPDGVKNILSFLHSLKKGKIITLIGCGGDRDKTKRPIMADIACKYSDIAIFTSDNPRTEDPIAILEDMRYELNYDNYYVIVNRREAIEKAISIAENGDIVTVLGKGHEDYQIIGYEKTHFSDKEEILKVIKG